jgi:hypothetical protein
MASMSSGFRHVSQGIAGFTGAPRPTLVNSSGVLEVEQENEAAARSALNTSRRFTRGIIR